MDRNFLTDQRYPSGFHLIECFLGFDMTIQAAVPRSPRAVGLVVGVVWVTVDAIGVFGGLLEVNRSNRVVVGIGRGILREVQGGECGCGSGELRRELLVDLG